MCYVGGMNVHYRKIDVTILPLITTTDLYVTKPGPYTYEFRTVVNGNEPGTVESLGCADAVPKMHDIARNGFTYVEG